MERQSNFDQPEFSQKLQHKISKCIILATSTFFLILVAFLLVVCFIKINIALQEEDLFLQFLSNQQKSKIEQNLQNKINFVESTSSLTKIFVKRSLVKNGCDNNWYICNISDYQNYGALMDKYYTLIKANSKMLKNNQNLVSIFIYFMISSTGITSSNTLVLNLTFLNPQMKPIDDSMFQSIGSQLNKANIKSYSLINFIVNGSSIYEVFCRAITIQNYSARLCIVESKFIFSTRSNAANIYFYANSYPNLYATSPNNQYFILNNSHNSSFILNNSPKIIIEDYIRYLSENGISNLGSNMKENIVNCLTSEIQIYSVYSLQQLSNGISLKCKEQNDGRHAFGPYWKFYLYNLSFDDYSRDYAYKEVTSVPQQSIQLIISSNATYFKNIEEISTHTIATIQNVGKALLFIVCLLLYSLEFAQTIFEKWFIPNINFIQKLASTLKNHEDKAFIKLIQSYQPKILNCLVRYFQIFFWISNLQKSSNKNIKYKKLLHEGVSMFKQQRQYNSVNIFLYLELIYLEEARVEKLVKMKELPQKKKQSANIQQKDRFQKKTFTENLVIKAFTFHKKNDNLQLPDQSIMMKNISEGVKMNKGVRFSSQIQTIEIEDGPTLRKSRYSSEIKSNESIKNENQDESQKKSKESLHSVKDQSDTSYASVNEVARSKKREISLKGLILSENSIHFDLNDFKFDVEDEKQVSFDSEEEEDLFKIHKNQILVEVSNSYSKIQQYLQQLITIKEQLNHCMISNQKEQIKKYNEIFELILKKYKIIFCKLENQKQIREDNSVMLENQLPSYSFQDLVYYKSLYLKQINKQLLEQAQLLMKKIKTILKTPISYKDLEELCKSKNISIKLEARHLFASECNRLKPFLDYEVLKRCFLNLGQEKCSNILIQKQSQLIIQTLQEIPQFQREVQELKLIKQFYNFTNKKFYFLVDMNITMELFKPIFLQFFKFIDSFDLINIFNLTMNEDAEQMEIISEIIKPLEVDTFLGLFQQLIQNKNKNKDKNSVKSLGKTSTKKLIFEKDFLTILTKIEQDNTSHSKFVVIFLGQDASSASSTDTEDSSSYSQNRVLHQRIYEEITRQMKEGYFHIILIGSELNHGLSKHGKIKKYVKQCPQLLELDVNCKNPEENYRELQRFLI